MKKLMIMVTMVLTLVMGMPVMAAEASNYDRVRNGLGMDIIALENEEDDDIEVTSVKIKDCATEQVAVYDVYFTEDDVEYRYWIYLNGETDECIAILYNITDDDVEDQRIATLAEVAADYE